MPLPFKTIINNAFSIILTSLILSACGGGGGSTPTPTPIPTTVIVTCPNSASKTAATLDLANALCTAPLLLTISPTTGANAVSVDTASVEVTTDSTLDISSITTANVALKAGAIDVVGTVSAVGTKAFRFSITSKFNYAQPYTFTATVKDTLGKTLVVNSTFTTASVACVSPQVPNSTGNSCVTLPLYSSTPILLPDLAQIYSTLCTKLTPGRIVSQSAVALDLNKDGKKDFIFPLWCAQNVGITTEPVVNRVVAFVQQANGSFINATKDLFGTDQVSISGASNFSVAYDFNGDGYDDIVIGTNNEDGRLLPDSLNNIQNGYIMSTGDGKYSVGKFGTLQWGYQVYLMDNELGKKDLVASPIGYGSGSDAWRYDKGWNQLTGNYSNWFRPNSVVFKRRASSEGSQITIADLGRNEEFGLSLYTRTTGTDWTRTAELSFSPVTWVPYISWNSSQGLIPLMTVDGQDYVMSMLDQGCELKIRPTEESIAVMVWGRYKLSTPVYNGTVLVEGQNMTWESKLIGISTASNKLARLSLQIKNETAFSSARLSCMDVNGDGYDDIVVLRSGQGNVDVSPLIYVNDKQGGFALVDPKYLPLASTNNDDTNSMMVDIDGDGIQDILYWPANGSHGSDKVQYQIFKGLRNIGSLDLK